MDIDHFRRTILPHSHWSSLNRPDYNCIAHMSDSQSDRPHTDHIVDQQSLRGIHTVRHTNHMIGQWHHFDRNRIICILFDVANPKNSENSVRNRCHDSAADKHNVRLFDHNCVQYSSIRRNLQMRKNQ